MEIKNVCRNGDGGKEEYMMWGWMGCEAVGSREQEKDFALAYIVGQ
jgi:hypothetical protein